MNVNRNNRRSVPTLVISALAVVAAAITWLSFKQVAANAPPTANPHASANGTPPGPTGAHVETTIYTQPVVAGATNFNSNRNPRGTNHGWLMKPPRRGILWR